MLRSPRQDCRSGFRRYSRFLRVTASAFLLAMAIDSDGDNLPCDREMRKTFETLQAWRRQHDGRYPGRIVDLKHAGLSPSDAAMCPEWRAERLGADAAHKEITSRAEKGDPPGTYEYELSTSVLKSADERTFLPLESPPYTRQDLKIQLLRRPFFEQVPVLRCSSHRESAPAPFAGHDDVRRNATAEGGVYWSRLYWEELWVNDVPYCAREANVLFGLKGPPFHTDQHPTDSRCLDLRTWNAAFGDHAWWWTYPFFEPRTNWQSAAHLEPFFQGRHGRTLELAGTTWWLNGLVQLQGRIGKNAYREPGRIAFVWERRGLAVARKFTYATWLQGTVWVAAPGQAAGWLVWHYADGKVERVPIVYGQTTARFWGDTNQINREINFPKPVWEHHETAVAVGKERWLRLYQQTWTNPHPNVLVTSLDFLSNTNSPAAPFLIAVNVTP